MVDTPAATLDETPSSRRGNIDALVQPRSVAIVGASSDPRRLGGRPLAYLRKVYSGPLYPINPRHAEVQGVQSYPSLNDLPDVPDLVLVLVSADEAVQAAADAARLGARAAIVFSSGFSEVGSVGSTRQAELTEIARQSGMRILGPNTNGLLGVPTNTWVTFAGYPEPPLPLGPVAIASQSGACALSLYRLAREEGLAVNYLCGTGNEADVTVAEMLEYFVERPDVSVLVGYAETIRQAERLLAVADRARELDKPLVFAKVGRSRSGQRAALSHTGSIVGSDAAVDAAFTQHGILRARSMEQIVRWVQALSTPKRPRGRRVGILTASGGMGIMLADAAEDAGLEVPELGEETQREIRETVPDFAATSNPVDVTGQVVNDPGLLGRVLASLDRSPDVDILAPVGLGGVNPRDIEQAVALASASDKPYIVWQTDSEIARRLRGAGLLAFRDSVTTVDAVAALVRYSTFVPSAALSESDPIASDLALKHQNGIVLEHDARRFLARFGVASLNEQTVQEKGAAIKAAREIGYPVALKALSYDYVHKTEAGAVELHLQDDSAVAAGFDRIERRVAAAGYGITTFLVQAMAPSGLEMIVGLRRDPQFGPLVTIGLGGSLVEILGQVACRLAPLSYADAYQAMAELCQGRLVKAQRGLNTEQQAWLADLMVGIGRAGLSRPDIVEMDLNPVIVTTDKLYVVDAAIVVSAERASGENG